MVGGRWRGKTEGRRWKIEGRGGKVYGGKGYG